MTCFPDEVNWNNKEFTKEMLDYLRAVYCVHPMVLDALDYINSLESRIAELEGKFDQLTAHSDIERQDDKWIPVSERLPELFTIVLVCDCDGGMETDWIWNNKDGISRFMNSFKTVTHWMSLPQPPEVQE